MTKRTPLCCWKTWKESALSHRWSPLLRTLRWARENFIRSWEAMCNRYFYLQSLLCWILGQFGRRHQWQTKTVMKGSLTVTSLQWWNTFRIHKTHRYTGIYSLYIKGNNVMSYMLDIIWYYTAVWGCFLWCAEKLTNLQSSISTQSSLYVRLVISSHAI